MSRGNALEGSAEFTYEDKAYRLVLNNRVWIEAEEVLGYSILDAVEELRAALETGRNPRLKTMCAIVYGGLKQSHADLMEQDVVDMFFSGNPEFKQAVLQAMQGAQLPKASGDSSAEGNAEAPAPTPDGVGNESFSPGAKPGSRRKASGKKPRAR